MLFVVIAVEPQIQRVCDWIWQVASRHTLHFWSPGNIYYEDGKNFPHCSHPIKIESKMKYEITY
jgi:hypothetical protein